MKAVQLRLFPAPKPLVERLGADFFKRVPREPGVYLMSGEAERLLYVGKANNLRQRLGSYKNAQPERVSRKVIRLVHQVRAITWEVHSSPETALLRENELLRLHKPKFNVMNTRPEHYLFIGLSATVQHGISFRLTKKARAEAGEQLFGAFKGLFRVRLACAALTRCLWWLDHRDFPDLPFGFFDEKPRVCDLFLRRLDESRIASLVRKFFAGTSSELLQFLAEALAVESEKSPWFRQVHQSDLETLQIFFQFGPARNRRLNHNDSQTDHLIEQAELDDLLVLDLPAGSRPDSQAKIAESN